MQEKKLLSEQDRKRTEEIYNFCHEQNLADGWAGEDKYENFRNLLEIAKHARHPLQGASILDVGCGTGDLVAFLREYGIRDYLGVDIVKLSIDSAREKYPHHQFEAEDFLALELKSQYDFVLASGAMSVALETDNYLFMEAFVEKMWKSARVGVAFNFLTQKHEGQVDDALFLYEMDKVLASCRKVAPEAVLEHQVNHAGNNAIFLQAHVYMYRRS